MLIALSRFLGVLCYRNGNPCQPLQNGDCVPNEKANNAVKDIELLFKNMQTNLTTASHAAGENAFTTLHTSLAALNAAAYSEVKGLITKLEAEIIALINLRLTVFQSALEKCVVTEFDRLEQQAKAILALIKSEMATTIENVAKGNPSQVAEIVEDTEFGLQAKTFEQLTHLLELTNAAAAEAESTILCKLKYLIITEIENTCNGIRKLFREFYKQLKTFDAKYACDLRRDLDTVRHKLEVDTSAQFTSITQKDSYFILSLSRRVVEYLTGCPQSNPIPPNLLGALSAPVS
ncbi:hypothetical protein ECANGB1_1317 [Enterospora canceri]|uniref:Uncharacterized protein n=1 Tax=Enterospora canceri TaxID=1081671 RepID=A0A1Y1S7I6_9MICR|nr:hypothetical protein ECANGB1_1317 [Enterospora canceri]